MSWTNRMFILFGVAHIWLEHVLRHASRIICTAFSSAGKPFTSSMTRIALGDSHIIITSRYGAQCLEQEIKHCQNAVSLLFVNIDWYAAGVVLFLRFFDIIYIYKPRFDIVLAQSYSMTFVFSFINWRLLGYYTTLLHPYLYLNWLDQTVCVGPKRMWLCAHYYFSQVLVRVKSTSCMCLRFADIAWK